MAQNVYIIAGPNGAGKTTFARKFLPEYVKCPNFVNADFIAQGLSPFSPQQAAIKAGKLVLQQIHEFVRQEVNFAFETTLAGKTYVNLFKNLKKKKYTLHLFFLWIPDVKLAISRIEYRVSEGGHDIPDKDIRRRFNRSIINFFKLYQPLSDSWMLFNNAGVVPELIAKNNIDGLVVMDGQLFDKIIKMAG